MFQSFALALLWISPLLITMGCIAGGIWLEKVRQQRRLQQPRWQVVALASFVWAMHAGYLLGPWLWSSQRGGFAFLLMLPLAVPILGAAAFVAQRSPVPPRWATSGAPKSPSLRNATAGTLVLAYAVPMLVVFAAAPRPPAVVSSTALDLSPATGFFGWIFGVLGLLSGCVSVIALLVLTRSETLSSNPTPVQVAHFRQVVLIQRMVIGLIGLGIGCAILALWAMAVSRPWLGGGLGLLPLLASGAIVAYWNAREV